MALPDSTTVSNIKSNLFWTANEQIFNFREIIYAVHLLAF